VLALSLSPTLAHTLKRSLVKLLELDRPALRWAGNMGISCSMFSSAPKLYDGIWH
jgi:hypothetical protein